MTYYEEIEIMRREHPNTWDYYGVHRDNQVEDYFRDPCSFLQNTFMYAQKYRLVPIRDGFDRIGISQARAAHSVSALFLGAMLARHFCGGRFLNFKTDLYQNDEDAYSFSYIWTLISLYHDCGYSLEKNEKLGNEFRYTWVKRNGGVYSCDTQKRNQKNKVGYLLSSLSIDKTPWQERDRSWTNRMERVTRTETSELQHKLFVEYSRRPKCVYAGNSNQPIAFPYREEEEIIRYAAFRLTSSSGRQACVDHGIFGGYRFFDSMIKNYVDAYERQREMCPRTKLECFCYNEKKFCAEQISLFAYIADCIMNHNIWRQSVDSEDGEICQSMGLYYVIGTNYEKIRLLKNPLLFILAFADSLEPFKLFCKNGIDSHEYNQAEVWEIFDRVDLRFCGNTLIIKVPLEMKCNLYQSVQMMKQWLAIKCRVEKETFYISPIVEE